MKLTWPAPLKLIQGRFRGVVAMASKPIKSGLKYIVLAEAETGYVLNLIMHDKLIENLEAAGNYKIIAWCLDLLSSQSLANGVTFLQQNYEVDHCPIAYTATNIAVFYKWTFQLYTDSYYASP